MKFVQSSRPLAAQQSARHPPDEPKGRPMTEAFSAETTINRPVEEVWARLVDWDDATRWMSGVEGMRAQGPTAVGTELVFTTRGKQRTSQIAAMDPGRSITLRSVQGGVTADYVYECEPEGGGTRVSLVADCRMTGPIKLLGPVIRSAIRKADGKQLDTFAATFPPG